MKGVTIPYMKGVTIPYEGRHHTLHTLQNAGSCLRSFAGQGLCQFVKQRGVLDVM